GAGRSESPARACGVGEVGGMDHQDRDPPTAPSGHHDPCSAGGSCTWLHDDLDVAAEQHEETDKSGERRSPSWPCTSLRIDMINPSRSVLGTLLVVEAGAKVNGG